MMTKEMMKKMQEEGTLKIELMKNAEVILKRYVDFGGRDTIGCQISASSIDTRLSNTSAIPYTENKEELDKFIRECIKDYGRLIASHLTTLYNKTNNHDIAD